MVNLIEQFEGIRAARSRIAPHIHKTPLLHSRVVSEQLGCTVYVKAEHLQKTGSFKARGAMNFLLCDGGGKKALTTFSSGNHGQAVAWAGGKKQRKVTVFMPEDANPLKKAAAEAYGGEVRLAGLSSDDRQRACLTFADQYDATVVPAYDHPWIVQGQGTAMLEVLEDLPIFDAALIPVGGGGLISGNSLALHLLRPHCPVFACEPQLADDVRQSLESGARVRIANPPTMAEGVRNLCVGELNWAIIRQTVSRGLTCSENQIVEAMKLFALHFKQWVEPTGAVTLACLLNHRDLFRGKTVVIYATGGNLGIEGFTQLVRPG